MKQLLTDILEQLKPVPGLRYVDEDWGQLDFYSPNPPVQFPAAVVDCINVTYTNEGKLGQLGDVQIRIRVADQKLTNSSGKAPTTQRTQAFAIYDLLRDIHKALHGWTKDKAAGYTAPIRTSLRRAQRQDGMRIHELVYTCRIVDATARPATMRFAVAETQIDMEKL